MFVLVGAAVDIRYAAQAGPAVVLLLCCVLLFRMAGVFCCMLGGCAERKGEAVLYDSLYAEGNGAGRDRRRAAFYGPGVRDRSF